MYLHATDKVLKDNLLALLTSKILWPVCVSPGSVAVII